MKEVFVLFVFVYFEISSNVGSIQDPGDSREENWKLSEKTASRTSPVWCQVFYKYVTCKTCQILLKVLLDLMNDKNTYSGLNDV